MGAPIGIGLVAGIAFPAMIIGWLVVIHLKGTYYDSSEICYSVEIALKKKCIITNIVHFVFKVYQCG